MLPPLASGYADAALVDLILEMVVVLLMLSDASAAKSSDVKRSQPEGFLPRAFDTGVRSLWCAYPVSSLDELRCSASADVSGSIGHRR